MGETSLPEIEKTFQLQKTYQVMFSQTKRSVFVFPVLFLILSKGFLFGGHHHHHLTDARFFGRQSEAALLVKQENPSSNLTKLGQFPDST